MKKSVILLLVVLMALVVSAQSLRNPVIPGFHAHLSFQGLGELGTDR